MVSVFSRPKPALVVIALLLTLVHSTFGQSKDADHEVRYEDAARTQYERFHAGVWSTAEIAPRLPSETQRRHVVEVLSVDLHDCSDAQYRCVFGAYRVFAVPRETLLRNATYVVAGSTLHVEECFRGAGTTCQVALISSDCQERLALGVCKAVVGGRSKSNDLGPVLYFIYNEDFGVTAYGSSLDPLPSTEEMRVAASQSILKGNTGLLSN